MTSPSSAIRIGLLECDHVAARFRGIGGDYADMFRRLFDGHLDGVPVEPGGAIARPTRGDLAPASDHPGETPDVLELVPFDLIGGEPPPDPGACDAWLCTGSRHSVYDDVDWVAGLLGFVRDVRDAGVPFVGVCFGHQALAQALGGRVERARTGWGAGIERVAMDASEPWMDPPADELALHFMHRDQISVVPPGGEVLGRAEHCPVALLRVGERMLGIQAHPEFTAAYTDALLTDRVPLIGEDEVAAARAGLAQPTDEATLARWMARMLGAPAPVRGA